MTRRLGTGLPFLQSSRFRFAAWSLVSVTSCKGELIGRTDFDFELRL
jgi:hypothetical protein